MRLNGIYFGSYWMKSNDVVYLMAQELEKMCQLQIIDTGVYSGNRERWFAEDTSRSKRFPVRWINEDKLLSLIESMSVDFIILNSGGLSLRPSSLNVLKQKGIVCVGISLSDPDVFQFQSNIYSAWYDLFYTNSVHALRHLYSAANIRLLPFAASPDVHRPLPDVPLRYDIVVVGHARPERIRIMRSLARYFQVGMFGSGWGSGSRSVHGEEHVRAINSGRLYLSFSSTTAHYMNLKIGLFEAVACQRAVVTDYFPEIERYFHYGVEVIGYTSKAMLLDLVAFYITNQRLRHWIADNAYQRLLQEHTWKQRWEGVLDDIQRCRLGQNLAKRF